MGEFTLDTSGGVALDRDRIRKNTLWSDLDAFTQGCGDAMARYLYERLLREGWTPKDAAKAVAFHNWAPETLAHIIKDCSEAHNEDFGRSRTGGEYLWIDRQARRAPGFPPLTVSPGDDGRLYLRGAA